MKLWLYQLYILAYLSWPFLVHDLCWSFALELQKRAMPILKHWVGVGRSVETGVLFRTKKHLGLGCTSITDHYQRMQIVKCDLLANSVDKFVKTIYRANEIREAAFVNRRCSTKAYTEAKAQTKLILMFPSQSGRQGLGAGNFDPYPERQELRKLNSSTGLQIIEEKRMQHSATLVRQGVWREWYDKVEPFDLSWKNLIWGPGPHLIKFVLTASVNWVRTPDLLQLFSYTNHAKCPLCSAPLCSLHHILVNCKPALHGKRYTWRHDSVLGCLEKHLRPHVESFNEKLKPVKPALHISKSFHLKGESKARRATRPPTSLLTGATDWKIQVEYDDTLTPFPVEIFSTNQRPDMVIWSVALKRSSLSS